MNRRAERQVTTLVRARDFLKAHWEESSGYASMFAQFEAQVNKALAEHERYRNGKLAYAAGVARRQELRTQINRRYVVPAARVGARAAVAHPAVAKAFTAPKVGASMERFRAGSHAMATDAVTHQPILVAHGLSETFGRDFEAALVEYDAAVEAMNEGRREHVGATSTLRLVIGEGMQLLRLFDGINGHRFADRPDVLAEWASARNVAWEKGGKDVDVEQERVQAQ